MAVTVDLITGHGESDHITSFDARTFNRALFGGEKYILEDADYLWAEVNASAGTVNIAPGSLLWSGMHIRVEKEGSLTYAKPASSDTVYVWLHYKRNPATLVETAEFVTTTGTTPENSLIQDKISDEATEAYTLFCSFHHDTIANTSTGLKTGFSFLYSLDSSIKRQQTNNASFQNNVSTQIGTFTAETNEQTSAFIEEANGKINEFSQLVTTKSQEIDTKVAEFQKSVSKPVLNALGVNYTKLCECKLSAGKVKLSESANNFAFIVVIVSIDTHYEAKILPCRMAQKVYGANHINAFFTDYDRSYTVSFRLDTDNSGLSGGYFGAYDIHAKEYANILGVVNVSDVSTSNIEVEVYGIGRIQ